jgi:large repetitive protein
VAGRRVSRRLGAAATVVAAVAVTVALAQHPVNGAFTGVSGSTSNQVTAATNFCTTPGSTTVNATEDSTVDQALPTSASGGDDYYMIVVTQGPASTRRSFVRFAMPAIPSRCDVTSATLRLYTDGADAGQTLGVYRADPAAPLWTEAGLTWNNQPAGVGTPATTVTVATMGYLSWTVTTLVRDLYTGANNGFVIRDQAENGSGPWQQYFARQTPNPPKLDITWG